MSDEEDAKQIDQAERKQPRQLTKSFGENQDLFSEETGVLILELCVGDSVAAKLGVLDPDSGTDIGGWQGRIEEIDDGRTVFIRWDSITLQHMGLDLVIRCENENFDWGVMTLNTEDIEPATARDSEPDVDRIVFQLRMEMLDDPQLDTE